MNNKTIKYLKELLNNNIKESIKEVSELTQLSYVLSVILLIDTIDEVIMEESSNKKLVKDFKINIKIIDAVNFKFLSYELCFDGKSLRPMEMGNEIKTKMNEVINIFNNDNIRNFLKKDFSIEMELEKYSKFKLADKILGNMLSEEMRKIVDFLFLDNDIDKKEVIRKRKNKI